LPILLPPDARLGFEEVTVKSGYRYLVSNCASRNWGIEELNDGCVPVYFHQFPYVGTEFHKGI
jgi:hypothetical protein